MHIVPADKGCLVKGICEQVGHHLWSGHACAAYRGIHALHFVHPWIWCMLVKVDSGEILSEQDEVSTHWADYFEQLYKADPQCSSGGTGGDSQACVLPLSTLVHHP